MFWKQRIFEKRAENARHCLSPAGSRARGGPPPRLISVAARPASAPSAVMETQRAS